MGKDPIVELKLSCCMSHMSTTHLKHKISAAFIVARKRDQYIIIWLDLKNNNSSNGINGIMIITLLLSKITNFHLKMHSHWQWFMLKISMFWSTVIVLRVAFALSLLADKLLEKLGLVHTPCKDTAKSSQIWSGTAFTLAKKYSKMPTNYIYHHKLM